MGLQQKLQPNKLRRRQQLKRLKKTRQRLLQPPKPKPVLRPRTKNTRKKLPPASQALGHGRFPRELLMLTPADADADTAAGTNADTDGGSDATAADGGS